MNTPRQNKSADEFLDALLDDIQSLTDEEMLAEPSIRGENTKQVADHIRAILQQSQRSAASRKLEIAKEYLRQTVAEPRKRYSTLSIADARKLLERVLFQKDSGMSRLTFAGRNVTDLSDEDVFSLLDDLDELGILRPNKDLDP